MTPGHSRPHNLIILSWCNNKRIRDMENWKEKMKPVWAVLWAIIIIATSAGAFNFVHEGGWFYAVAGIANLALNGYAIYKIFFKK